MTAQYWRDLPTTAFDQDTSDWIAVLPVAAIEQHGPHLPVGVDSFIAEGLVQRCVSALDHKSTTLFLPVQQIGKSNEHINFPGTLTLDWQTCINAWIEIAESVERAGLRKLLIVTSHGGNVSPVDIVARELRQNFDMLVVHTSWARLGDWQNIYQGNDQYTDIHGGLCETSLMLALRPDLVDMDRAKNFRSTQISMREKYRELGLHASNANISWMAEDLHAEGTVGDASSATAELGESDIAAMVSGFCRLIAEMDQQAPPGFI